MEGLNSLRNCPKRPHKKSRSGCTPCKTRRVKSIRPVSPTVCNAHFNGQCDERTPQCTRCIRQGSQCDLLSSHRQQVAAPRLYPSPIAVDTSLDLNMLDLELIHHWTISTYDSLTSSPLLRIFWLRNTVKVGFRCGFVMRAILALSAVHMGYHQPDQREVLLHHALTYHNMAAMGARESMDSVTRTENVEMWENLFLYSVLLIFYSRSEHHTPDWMAFFRGSRHLGQASESHQRSSSLTHPLINYMMGMSRCRERVSQASHFTTLLDRIHRLQNTRSASEQAAFMHATEELSLTFAVLSEFAETRDMLHAFLWISNVSDHRGDFIALLQDPTPSQEALVIFNYFCIIIQRIPARWWSERWVQGLKNGAFNLLDEEHKTWITEPPFWDN
ncbi:hypothetical protein CCHL11_00141 [Colletotrichum chlorophyti]|uniref:Zn(2)-C6 fungal-type domain-containing protein n=1 Tax=Colletotrichum chlorophyti TaxID=708187 RepID=A0A1Q8RTZ3_9PEZI|nr:hypothetical protein CCHL11_00141 [Colletotrichum chlorophyti]